MQRNHLIKCAMDSSYGDMANDPTGKIYFLRYLCLVDVSTSFLMISLKLKMQYFTMHVHLVSLLEGK